MYLINFTTIINSLPMLSVDVVKVAELFPAVFMTNRVTVTSLNSSISSDWYDLTEPPRVSDAIRLSPHPMVSIDRVMIYPSIISPGSWDHSNDMPLSKLSIVVTLGDDGGTRADNHIIPISFTDRRAS